ncbi:hypothetical protein [Bacteroidetes bacterium endosymbiont of Geopemphigus sp.]|uniref:hypothetical protein n=1 Tax=Bacteroidetes bacterium endosymbiont of Geopemphigus sp. TaxID=2047937 RepID=UPI0018A7F695|nr:hypothetical protein [Bacteroidetes bacterium endosymbiont of Geopemphigus sp.]
MDPEASACQGIDKAMTLAQKSFPIYNIGIEQGERVPNGKVQKWAKVIKKFNGQ